MDFNSELEVRQEIMIRLDVVYELINDLIRIQHQHQKHESLTNHDTSSLYHILWTKSATLWQ